MRPAPTLTIVNVSDTGADAAPCAVALNTSVYVPGRRRLPRASTPWNRRRLRPLCPGAASAPRTSVRLHAWARLFAFVCATQRPCTFRPATLCVKAKLIAAASSSVNLNVVPTGARVRENVAARLPSRHWVWDWDTAVIDGRESPARICRGTAHT